MKKLLNKMKNLAKKAWTGFVKGCKWIVKQIQNGAQWCMDNQEVVYVVCGAASAVSWITKKFRKSRVEREQNYQRTHLYDYSIGHHWTLRRELTSDEMFELANRKMNGERMGDILQSMRVLA